MGIVIVVLIGQLAAVVSFAVIVGIRFLLRLVILVFYLYAQVAIAVVAQGIAQIGALAVGCSAVGALPGIVALFDQRYPLVYLAALAVGPEQVAYTLGTLSAGIEGVSLLVRLVSVQFPAVAPRWCTPSSR